MTYDENQRILAKIPTLKIDDKIPTLKIDDQGKLDRDQVYELYLRAVPSDYRSIIVWDAFYRVVTKIWYERAPLNLLAQTAEDD